MRWRGEEVGKSATRVRGRVGWGVSLRVIISENREERGKRREGSTYGDVLVDPLRRDQRTGATSAGHPLLAFRLPMHSPWHLLCYRPGLHQTDSSECGTRKEQKERICARW